MAYDKLTDADGLALKTLFDDLTGNAGGAAQISQFEQNQSFQCSVGEF